LNDTNSPDRLFFEFERSETRLSYMVCSIPRSGSSLLCELLTDTGLAGAPAEFFSPSRMDVLKQGWGVQTLDEYVRELLARKTSPNGVFGVKAHWSQYNAVFEGADPQTVLPSPRFVFITRGDRLRQAVSWVRALQTRRFTAQDRSQAGRRPLYDREGITQKLRRIDREEKVWEKLFDRYGIVPHRVVYEDLVAAEEGTVRGVLGALGLDPPVDLRLVPPVHDRQADELSDEWVERYLAEARTG